MTPIVITFGLAAASVGLWTVRVATIARGSRGLGTAVSMIEATTYAVAISRLVGTLAVPIHILAYAVGVGTGAYVGSVVSGKLRLKRSSPSRKQAGSTRPFAPRGNPNQRLMEAPR